MLISVVIPIYRCASCLHELYRRLRASLEGLGDFELIFVNDCSPQNDWEIVQELALADPRVRGVNLARNFGQHAAITAGLDYARGDWVVVMDGDLQDQPEEIPRLYEKAREGFDVVFAQRVQRQDNLVKKLASRFFAFIYNSLSDIKLDPACANFSISSRQVIENFRRVREQSRAFGLIIRWLGFRIGYQPVQHGARYAGETSYTFYRSLNLAIDNIVSQSTKPLRLFIKLGFLLCIASLVYGGVLIIRYFFHGIKVEGWASLMVSIYFLAGLTFANLGIIGLYLGKQFEQSKERPLYIVREHLNITTDQEHAPAPH
ncbi:MAG: glycosyltransferase family 2 protein [Armatimonadota bacterium]